MITKTKAKPWIGISKLNSEDSQASRRRLELMTALLERGYPVMLRDADVGAAERTILPHQITIRDQGSSIDNTTIDAATLSIDDVVAKVEMVFQGEAPTEAAKTWKPWFPVIDFGRCTNCMQCLSFCLFDVYGVSEAKQIQVQNQDNCKTDCPACSRVCPEVAIMFPKYKASPINGDAVSDDDVRREGMKVDISSLLGGDIYSMLRDRSVKAKSRFSAERDEDRALKERKRCLDKLKSLIGDLDIPLDALASLPSTEQIKAKAEAAASKK